MGKGSVTNVTVVSDMAPLDKFQNYGDKDVHNWMTKNRPCEFPSRQVIVTAFVCKWRGAISSKSYFSWLNEHKRKTQKRRQKRVGLQRGHLLSVVRTSVVFFKCQWHCSSCIMSRVSLRPRSLNIRCGCSCRMWSSLFGWENTRKKII